MRSTWPPVSRLALGPYGWNGEAEGTRNMGFGLGSLVQWLGGIGGAVLRPGLWLSLYGWYLLCILFQ